MLLVIITFVNYTFVCFNSWLPLLVRHHPDVDEAYRDDSLTLVEKLKVKEDKASNYSAYSLIWGYCGALFFLVIVLAMFVGE